MDSLAATLSPPLFADSFQKNAIEDQAHFCSRSSSTERFGSQEQAQLKRHVETSSTTKTTSKVDLQPVTCNLYPPPLRRLNGDVGHAAAGICFRVPISVTLVVGLVAHLDHCRGAWKHRYNRCRLAGRAKRVTGNANSSSSTNRISVPRTIGSVRAVPVPILIRVVLPILLILIHRILSILLVLTRSVLPALLILIDGVLSVLLVLTRSILQVLLIGVSRLLILAERILTVLLIAASRLLILVNRILAVLLVTASVLLALT
jgi:hypothetical protein